MAAPRGTTPTLTLELPADSGIDLTAAHGVYVTLASRGKKLTLDGDALTVAALSVEVYLSQAQTLAFPEGPVDIQLNWTDGAGNRWASDIAEYTLTRQLLDKVVK